MEIKNNFNDGFKYPPEFLHDKAARLIVKKMRQGELITHPSDKRKFENMKFERLKAEDKVFYKGEYDSLDEQTQERMLKEFSKQFVKNGWSMPEKKTLDAKVQSGDLIYVNNYTKADGTKVHGYYRRKPVY